MPDAPVISVDHVSKAYRIWESPARRLISPGYAAAAALAPGRLGERLREKSREGYRDFYALRDISFEVRRGEAVGIIGRNGSGKSTLLQIIAGTLQPSAGSVSVQGRVAALLELGSGFNPEFTGRENVILNGTILGFTAAEMEARLGEIAAFAEIGDFMDEPVKTYSSGMMMRLAFAVQTSVEPDILIVDEALSVGDFFFSQRCMRRMQELRARGTTLLFVSHDMSTVRDVTTRALLLQEGRTVFFGETQHAISLFFQEKPANVSAPASGGPEPAAAVTPVDTRAVLAEAFWRADASGQPLPDAGAIILGMALLDAQGKAMAKVELGQPAVLSLLIEARTAAAFNVAVELKNRHDQVACSLSTIGCGLAPLVLSAGQLVRIDFEITFNLEAGLYAVCGVIGLPSAKPNRGTRSDATPWAGPIKVDWDYENQSAPFLGLFGPPVTVRTHLSG
jgi:lipopolysaccharide transport system ATP-binding protein